MTIRDFVLSQQPQSITDWELLIKKNGYDFYREGILLCAEYYNFIIINHDADFTNNINQ